MHDNPANRFARFIPMWLTSYPLQARADGAWVALEDLGPAAWPVIPDLARLANSTNTAFALSAIQVLSGIGSPALPTLAGIITNRSADPYVRLQAMQGILAFGSNAAPALPAMLGCLQNGDQALRKAALSGIQGLGIRARPAIPIFVQYLEQDKDPELNYDVMQTLGELAIEPDLSVPTLIHGLQSPHQLIQFYSAFYLGRFGRQARAALPALTNAWSDSDPYMRWAATNSIRKITQVSQPN